MSDTFYELYRHFYSPLETEHRQQADWLHHELVERLEKEDRIRVLNIIDLKDCYTELLAVDSFTAGFRLAWDIAHELNFKEDLL